MLPPRARRLLVAEQGQALAQARARLARLDDRIDEAALRRHERVAELVLVAEGLLLDALAAEDDLDRALTVTCRTFTKSLSLTRLATIFTHSSSIHVLLFPPQHSS